MVPSKFCASTQITCLRLARPRGWQSAIFDNGVPDSGKRRNRHVVESRERGQIYKQLKQSNLIQTATATASLGQRVTSLRSPVPAFLASGRHLGKRVHGRSSNLLTDCDNTVNLMKNSNNETPESSGQPAAKSDLEQEPEPFQKRISSIVSCSDLPDNVESRFFQ